MKNQSGRIHSFEMTGHADFAEHGKDLVCAGASAVSFGAVNAIIALTGETPEIQQGGRWIFESHISGKLDEKDTKFN